MTLEITSRNTFEPTLVKAEFVEFVNQLNIAAAKGFQFVVAEEVRPGADANPVALETKNITRIREIEDGEEPVSAYLS